MFPTLQNHDAACEEIDRFFKTTRRSIKTCQTAISKHINGLVPDNPIGERRSDSGLRPMITSIGQITIQKDLRHDFLLAIKHPAAFTAMLETLVGRFPCYGIIRNPLSVLASWNSAAVPLEDGHAPAAESLDTTLAETLHRTRDKTERQLHLLSWFYESYRRVLPDRSIVRYENIISSGGRALNVITPEADELTAKLENKNKNKSYDWQLMEMLGEILLKTDGAFWEFYSRESVECLLTD